MKKFAVIGNPIEQSKSPYIHHAFAKQSDEKIEYNKILVELGDFSNVANEFFLSGGSGLNITAPFKFDAFEYADKLTERAKLAEAVNTLAKQSDGSILGDNTDGVGLLNDVTERLGWSVKEKSVLFLGAGGAVRGVLFPFLSAEPVKLVVANRTQSKAEVLEKKFRDYGPIQGIGLEQLAHQDAFDLIINASSAGLNKARTQVLPSRCFHKNTYFYDMSYSNEPTAFLQWVIDHTSCESNHYSDGLGMLVGQAAESFKLWMGREPDVLPVMALLNSRDVT